MNINSPQNENFEQTNDSISIQDFYYICKSQWKLFAISIVIALAIAFIHLVVTQPTYTRTATVLIKNNQNKESINGISLSEMGLSQGSTNLNNELIIFKSLTLMQDVVKRLDLTTLYEETKSFRKNVLYGDKTPVKVTITDLPEEESVEFELKINNENSVTLSSFKRARKKISSKPIDCQFNQIVETPVGRIVISKTDAFEPDRVIKVYRKGLYATTNEFMKKFSISRINKLSTVVDLHVDDQSIERADDILNSLIAIYSKNWLDDKNRSAVNTAKFIDNRLISLKHELDSIDQVISSFKSENLIPDIDKASNLYMNKIDRAHTELMVLNNRLWMCNYFLDYLSNNQDDLMPANIGIDNSSIETMISSYNEKMMRRNRWILNSSDKNPLVKELNIELENMKSLIIKSIKNQIATLETLINNINKENSRNTDKIAANPTQAAYLISVERLQKVKESLYSYLLQKLEETQLNQVFSAYNTNVITHPHGVRVPTSPRKKIVLLFALIFGIGIPVVFLYLKETLNTKVRSREDLKQLSIPIIGEIPMFNDKKRFDFKIKGEEKCEIVVKDANRNIINEAFRILRTNVDFMSSKEASSNVLMTTSFNPGSGKSFLSLNMAVSLAIKGKKVLMIDGDLRRGSLSTCIDSPTNGLSNYLAHQIDDIEKIIVQVEDYKNLHILPSGTIPPNPTELVEDPRFASMIAALRNKYEYIIIDCPPINIVADSQIIEKFVDRTIFVIRAGLMDRNMIPEVERIYRNNMFNNLSLILNAVKANPRHGGYGKYGDYYKN